MRREENHFLSLKFECYLHKTPWRPFNVFALLKELRMFLLWFCGGEYFQTMKALVLVPSLAVLCGVCYKGVRVNDNTTHPPHCVTPSQYSTCSNTIWHTWALCRTANHVSSSCSVLLSIVPSMLIPLRYIISASHHIILTPFYLFVIY